MTCRECLESIDNLDETLEHYINKHPNSKILRDVLAEIRMEETRSRCNERFDASVSIGGGVLMVPSNCGDCIEEDPLSGLLVQERTPKEVVER